MNKRSLMAFSAILILIFHFWVVENSFVKGTSYLGVDIFFFLSGYSLADKSTVCRVKFLYLRFVIASLVAFVYNKWSLSYLIKVLSGVDLIENGGGAFLWFIPTILVYYMWYPLFKKYDKINRIRTIGVVSCLWLAVSFIVVNNYHQLGIVWLRIPVFLLGYYFTKVTLKDSTRYILGIILVVVGVLLTKEFGYIHKLQTPIYNMFYICIIPLTLGIILLLQKVRECKLVVLIGSSTFEMYVIQMIFGYDLMSSLINIVDSILIVNIITVVTIVCISITINQIWGSLVRFLLRYKLLQLFER